MPPKSEWVELSQGWTPLHHAAESGHHDILRLSWGYVPYDVGKKIICVIISNILLYEIMCLICAYNAIDESKHLSQSCYRTPLHYAAECGHLDILRVLIKEGSAEVDGSQR